MPGLSHLPPDLAGRIREDTFALFEAWSKIEWDDLDQQPPGFQEFVRLVLDVDALIRFHVLELRTLQRAILAARIAAGAAILAALVALAMALTTRS